MAACREVRVADSMIMIGEGETAGGSGVMPIRPMAFRVFVKTSMPLSGERLRRARGRSANHGQTVHGERAGFVADPFGNHWSNRHARSAPSRSRAHCER